MGWTFVGGLDRVDELYLLSKERVLNTLTYPGCMITMRALKRDLLDIVYMVIDGETSSYIWD